MTSILSRLLPLLLLVIAAVFVCQMTGVRAAETTNPTATSAEAYLLDVALPITGPSGHTLRRALETVADDAGEQPQRTVLLLRFLVPPQAESFGKGSDFGACYDLAQLLTGPKFARMKTVAFVPQSVYGHGVLVALACRERILAPTAAFGNAGVDETRISQTQLQGYKEIAKLPPALTTKLLDINSDLWEVETQRGIRLGTKAELTELRRTETFVTEPEEKSPAGMAGIFEAEHARRIGLVGAIAPNLSDVARILDIPAENIRSIPVFRHHGGAVLVTLRGNVTAARLNALIRQIDSVRGDFEMVILEIDSPGGSLADSLRFANYLAQMDRMQCRVIGYVPQRAFSDAALIALGCHELAIGPEAVLGGSGPTFFSETDLTDARRVLSTAFAENALRSWSLPAAMVDPNLDVFRMTHKGNPLRTAYFSDEEWQKRPDAAMWEKGERITTPDEPFRVKGNEAIELRLANTVAADMTDLKKWCRLENDPITVEPNWADRFAEWLSSPRVAGVLLFIAFYSFWTEIKTPGIGAGAFLAIVCFALFFWSHFLGGTVGWLEIILFLVGILFILLEIFVVPGFGLFGLGGGAAVLLSLILASQTFIIPRNGYQFVQFSHSLVMLAMASAFMILIAETAARFLQRSHSPKEMAAIGESEKLADYAYLLGQEGITATRLVPAGKARIGEKLVDVVSDCEMMEAGTPIRVAEVNGYRVVVVRQKQMEGGNGAVLFSPFS